MSPWWGKSSKESKEVKKSNLESILGSLHRKCIRPGPRRQRSDTISEKGSQSRIDSQSPSPPSKQVSRCHSFAEMPQAQPLPLPSSHFNNVSRADSGNSILIKPSVSKGSKTSTPLPKRGHLKIRACALVGERDLTTASSSSDSSSDTDDLSESRLLSPQASDYENGIKSVTASPSG